MYCFFYTLLWLYLTKISAFFVYSANPRKKLNLGENKPLLGPREAIFVNFGAFPNIGISFEIYFGKSMHLKLDLPTL